MNVPPPGGPAYPFGSLRARLRPMGVGDILDETFRLYRENFVLFLAIVAILDVPAQIINLLITVNAPVVLPFTPGQTPTDAQFQAFIASAQGRSGATYGTLLITSFATALMTAALAVAISRRYLGESATLGDAYRATLSRIGPLLLAIVWVGVRLLLLSVASVILIGLPFLIYFAVAWSLLSQVVMLEDAGGIEASRRSRELVRGYWWKTLGLFILTGLLVFILGRIPELIIAAIVGATAGPVVGGIAGLIVDVIVRPIEIIAPTLLFYDLKIRKEAFDLEAMAQQAGAMSDDTRY